MVNAARPGAGPSSFRWFFFGQSLAPSRTDLAVERVQRFIFAHTPPYIAPTLRSYRHPSLTTFSVRSGITGASWREALTLITDVQPLAPTCSLTFRNLLLAQRKRAAFAIDAGCIEARCSMVVCTRYIQLITCASAQAKSLGRQLSEMQADMLCVCCRRHYLHKKGSMVAKVNHAQVSGGKTSCSCCYSQPRNTLCRTCPRISKPMFCLAQDLATQDRLTKNVKDLLWLHAWDHSGKGSDPAAALKALQVPL